VAEPLEKDDDFAPPVPRAGSISARAYATIAAQQNYLDGLNAEQVEAVQSLDGPVLVLAGAGTGKTRVLTTRIAHILATGRARPGDILAVTFTNKAAREMRHRISDMVGEAVEGMPWLGTFHSIGAKILRRHAELAELKSDFTILDVDDQIRLIKQVLQAADIDDKRWPARLFASIMDGWKNRGLAPEDVSAGDSMGFADGRGKQLYAAYQARLKTLNAVDFGDLLLENLRVFRKEPDVLARYQQRFRYMLVDEYQDTNVAQYLWLRLLAQRAYPSSPGGAAPRAEGERTGGTSPGDPRLCGLKDVDGRDKPGHDDATKRAATSANICCVGDDDQSIYGWRGAEVDNILRFEKDFPGAKVIRLERNYRSTGHILAAASALIAHNAGRLGKTLRTEDVPGEKVTVTGAWDSEEEARAIGGEIEDLQRQGHHLSQIAILVRASFQMREFEDRFVTLGLPYRVIGGPRFYERQEIRDALAYFRAVCSVTDDLAFERIVNVPKRGLGDATVQLLHDYSRGHGTSLQESARALVATEEFKPKPRATIRDLVASFDRWRAQLDRISHTELAEIVLEESGYTAMWQNERSADAAGRLENLKELVRSMEGFENMRGFLEHIALVMDADGGDMADSVLLMTLHAAKGLEFETVYLPGWEEGLFPSQRSLDEQGRAGLEEERRLAHVGLTRARKRARIYFAINRRIHGLWNSTVPSRFIDELPEAHVEVTEASGGFAEPRSRFERVEPFSGSRYDTPGWQRAQARAAGQNGSAGRFVKVPPTIEGTAVRKPTGTASFSRGERVFHQKFGYGQVRDVDGDKLTVSFDKAGEKRVVASFVARA
jgi:DNA helicase-2/ATP-dependent DNA helicase PcrA